MSARGEIVELLRSDLYERVPSADPESMLWESPLRWKVRVAGTRDAPVVTIYAPGGEVFEGVKSRPMVAEALHRVLP
jgi:hypothetical protein